MCLPFQMNYMGTSQGTHVACFVQGLPLVMADLLIPPRVTGPNTGCIEKVSDKALEPTKQKRYLGRHVRGNQKNTVREIAYCPGQDLNLVRLTFA
jgi:hypothetical protein